MRAKRLADSNEPIERNENRNPDGVHLRDVYKRVNVLEHVGLERGIDVAVEESVGGHDEGEYGREEERVVYDGHCLKEERGGVALTVHVENEERQAVALTYTHFMNKLINYVNV